MNEKHDDRFGELKSGKLIISDYKGRNNTFTKIKYKGGTAYFKKGKDTVYTVPDIMKLIVTRSHIVLDINSRSPIKAIVGDGNYEYTDDVEIMLSCANPRREVLPLLLKCNPKIVAEIGVRYGITANYILENNKTLETYCGFEILPKHCEFLRSNVKDSRFILFEGDASETLKDCNYIFDFIFFDASHDYDLDLKILDSLGSHINDKSVIVFDDYDLPDVRKLVEECMKRLGNTIYGISSRLGIVHLQ